MEPPFPEENERVMMEGREVVVLADDDLPYRLEFINKAFGATLHLPPMYVPNRESSELRTTVVVLATKWNNGVLRFRTICACVSQSVNGLGP